jgi:tetratricopeptide (TPR) repeat protein
MSLHSRPRVRYGIDICLEIGLLTLLPPPGQSPRRPAPAWQLSVLLVCLVPVAAGGGDCPASAARGLLPERERPRIVVAGFTSPEASDPRDAWIATAAEELLAWRLRRVPSLITVPTVRVHQARRELTDEEQAPPGWPMVAGMLGATTLLTGSAEGNADAATLRLRLGPPASFDAVAQTTIGPESLTSALDAATRWVLDQLGVATLPPEVEKRVLARPSPSLSAVEYYARAVSAARTDKPRDALYYAQEAIGYDVRFRPALLLLAQLESRVSREGRLNAVRRLRVVSELARLVADEVDRVETEIMLGLLTNLTPSADAAFTRFETALALACEHGDPYGQIAAMSALGDLYMSLSPPRSAEWTPQQVETLQKRNLRRAVQWQLLSLEELEKLGDAVALAPAASKLALVYERLGEEQAALRMHERTLAAAIRTGSRRTQATAWMFLGQWHRRQEHWSQAIEATTRCLALAAESSRPAVRIALAEIYGGMNPPRPSDALREYEQAFEECRAGTDLNAQLLCVRQIARLRRELGQREKALAALREAIDLAHAMDAPEERELREQLAEWEREAR